MGAVDLFDSCPSRAWNPLGGDLFTVLSGMTSVQLGSSLK